MPDHPRTPLPPATPTPSPRTLGEAVIARWKDAACTVEAGKSPEPSGCCKSPVTSGPLTVGFAQVGTVSGPMTCCKSLATDDRLTHMGDPANHAAGHDTRDPRDATDLTSAGWMAGFPGGADDRPAVLRVTLDEGATLPSRATDGDAGLDLFPLANTLPRLMPQETRVFDTGVHVEIPAGYVGKVEGRSGLAKRGITPGGATIDAGYRGSIGVILTNHGQAQWVAEPSKAIAQLVIYPVALLSPMVVDSLGETARGGRGFGSSDRK